MAFHNARAWRRYCAGPRQKKTKRRIFIDTAAAPKWRADELPGKPGEAERESRSPFISAERRMNKAGPERMDVQGDLRGLLDSIMGKLLNLPTHNEVPRKE